MKIRIIDWTEKETFIDIDLEKVAVMHIKIISGDEILEVINKDYSLEEYDSCCNREKDYRDGSYEIYDFRKSNDENLLFDEGFVNRKDSDYIFQLRESV